MSMMFSNGRIDIQGQRGPFCGGPLIVDNAMPAILGGHMTESEWKLFCDNLNKTLEPLSQVVRKFAIFSSIATLAAFAIFTSFGLLLVKNPSTEDGPSITTFILPAVGFVVMIGALVVVGLLKSRHVAETRNNLTCVCDDQSRKSHMVSFHVRDQTHVVNRTESTSTYTTMFIEVQVSPNANMSDPISLIHGSSLGVSTGSSAPMKSVELRLSDLERLKPHLTDSEYELKRGDILATV